MTRCDKCGSEITLPFTCQHCGGKFCPDCRLPPTMHAPASAAGMLNSALQSA